MTYAKLGWGIGGVIAGIALGYGAMTYARGEQGTPSGVRVDWSQLDNPAYAVPEGVETKIFQRVRNKAEDRPQILEFLGPQAQQYLKLKVKVELECNMDKGMIGNVLSLEEQMRKWRTWEH